MTVYRRLKQIARVTVSNVDKKSVDGERDVRLCNYTDVYYNERITSDLEFMKATATADQVARFSLRAGDVLITKDSETADDIAIPAYVAADMPDVLCGYHLATMRPADNTDGRYLFWALTSLSTREQFSALATGVTRFGLRYETFGEVRVPLPPPAVQRNIAVYLDAETAHIDALIEKKLQMMHLLTSEFRLRRWAEVSSCVSGLQKRCVGVPTALAEQPWTQTRLKFLVDRPRGGVWGGEPGTDEVDVECYRVADFDRWGAIVAAEKPTVRSISRELLSQQALAAGDLLLEKSGGGEKQPVGFVAQFAGSQTPAICSNFIARLRPNQGFDTRSLTHLFASLYDLGLTQPFIKQTTGIQNLDVDAFLSRAGQSRRCRSRSTLDVG